MASGDPVYPKDPGGSMINDTSYLDRGSVSSSPVSSSEDYWNNILDREYGILEYDGTLDKAAKIMATAYRNGDNATIDKIASYWRDDQLRKEAYGREDSAYSRMIEDLRRSGINPYAMLQGASPIASNYSSSSSGTGNYSSAAQLSETKRHNKQSESWAIAGSLLSALLSMIAIAAIAL